jgi:hypothetical protein
MVVTSHYVVQDVCFITACGPRVSRQCEQKCGLKHVEGADFYDAFCRVLLTLLIHCDILSLCAGEIEDCSLCGRDAVQSDLKLLILEQRTASILSTLKIEANLH